MRKSHVLLSTIGLCVITEMAVAQSKSADQQVAEAVMALPEPLRQGAAVLGYRDGSMKLVSLRKGSNMITCLAADPARERWHVACYHNDLEPFMARGRQLRAGGMERDGIDSIRQAEIESGALMMPDQATALYSLTGPKGSFDPVTGEVTGARGLHVVYTPYATEETIGVSATPSRERPWLMYSGTPWAHVMIPRP